MSAELEYLKLFSTMYDDVNSSASKLNNHPEEFDYYSRAYLRAFATWVEGTVSMYKEVFSKSGHLSSKLPQASQLYIFEYDWRISNSGEPKIVHKKIKTKENIKCFFYVLTEIFEGYEVNFNDQGWSDLMLFYKSRDSMMHPKTIECLEVNMSQVKQYQNGGVWFLNQIMQLNHCMSRKNA